MNPSDTQKEEQNLPDEDIQVVDSPKDTSDKASEASEEQPDAEKPVDEATAAQEEAEEKPLSLEEQLKQAEEKLAEFNDRYLRLMAEFDNYRKRMMKEKAELYKTAGEKVITNILPVLDDMERAEKSLQSAENVEAVGEGIKLIMEKFANVLSKEGLQKIDTQNTAFDTDFHEAIAMVPGQPEELKGKVIDCVQTGYMLNDKVIRHAKVAVAQ